jgi:glutathionylspermidine synthase
MRKATGDIFEMAMDFVEWVLDESNEDQLRLLNIDPVFYPAMRASWSRAGGDEDPMLDMRLDLNLTDDMQVKLLEFNVTAALRPEMLIQYEWYEAVGKKLGNEQFNEYYEATIGVLTYLKGRLAPDEGLSFVVDPAFSGDMDNMLLLRAFCTDPDSRVFAPNEFVDLTRMGIDEDGHLINERDEVMRWVWLFYPWEDFEREIKRSKNWKVLDRIIDGSTRFLIPIWMQVLANKASLALMWKRYKSHPVYGKYLLATYLSSDQSREAQALRQGLYVQKPIEGQEGASVRIISGDAILGVLESIETEYGDTGYIDQEYTLLQQLDGYNVIWGSWVDPDGNATGFIGRGDKNLITGHAGIIIPHVIV